jgi:glutaminyl-tRNA synthetase
VSASHGVQASVHLYDRLFAQEAPESGDEDLLAQLKPNSLEILEQCWIEPGLANAEPEQAFQFERLGYFVADRYLHGAERAVFNRTIGLKDSSGR